MVPSFWPQTSTMKSGFTHLQTGPSHSIWFHIHIGSFSTSHLLRWVKSKRIIIMLGGSSPLQIRNGLISGQVTTLVSGYLHCCKHCSSSCGWDIVSCSQCQLSGLCQCWALSLSLSFHDSVFWSGNVASSLWPHCGRSLPRPQVPRVHAERAANCGCVWWKHRRDGLSALRSKCFWHHLGELSAAAERAVNNTALSLWKRHGLGTRTISSLLVTDSCCYEIRLPAKTADSNRASPWFFVGFLWYS